MNIRLLPACALAVLLCSCASTSVKKTSRSADYQGGRLTNIAVLTIEQRGILREGFENRFTAQLKQRGASAITTFNLLSLSEIAQDKPAAAQKFRAQGADAVLILRLANASSTYREVRPGNERYADTITGIESGMWYDYYSVAYMDMSPTYGNEKQQILLETVLFDLKTAKRIWSGVTQTVSTETMDRVAEMNTIVAKVLSAMQKDGMIP